MRRSGARGLVRPAAVLVLVGCLAGIGVLSLRWATDGPRSTVDAGALPARTSGTGAPSGADRTRAATSPVVQVPTADRGRLRSRSARLEDVTRRMPTIPTAVRIEHRDVGGPIVSVGVDPQGTLAVPPDPAVVAWYQYGPSPGEQGSAVLAGHVDYGGREGVFFRLADVPPGAVVVVTFADRSERRFTVVARRRYPKSDLPATAIFDRAGTPRLALITCGGEFDDSAHSYRENVVLYAQPIA